MRGHQSRGKIYARRAKGDLDLGLEPARIDPGGDLRWAEIITPGGLLPGGVEQDILEQTEDQNYRIGTRRVMDDRVFRYCKAGEDLNAQEGAFVGKGNAVGAAAGQNYWQGDGNMPIDAAGNHLAVGIPADTKTIYFDNKEPIAAHELVDGWIVGFGLDASTIFCMRIKDNEISGGSDADPDEFCKITLYRGMPVGQEGGGVHRCYVYANLYSLLLNTGGAVANQGKAGVMCVPLIKVAVATPYFWGLTWGVFYPLVGLHAIDVATRPNEREFWFDWNGTLIHRPANPAGDPWYQRGGFLLMDGSTAHDTVTNGDQLAMLQISP